jgi:hypothetical protein
MSRKCPQCLNKKDGPCPGAIERIYAIQGSKKKIDVDIEVGCPWFINSSEYGYSFWKFAKTLEEPVPDKDICDLLMIDHETLEETYLSAIKKLKKLKDTEDLQDFKEALIRKINTQAQDNTVYLPDEFAVEASYSSEEEKDQEAELFNDEKKRIRKGFGMPIHRDGKKTDLYGLYTKNKRPQAVKKNEKKDKK